jgi:hypothetical protein
MKTRIIRFFLVLIAIAIASAATYFLRQTDTTVNAERAVTDSLRGDVRVLAASIAEMRTAQVAYVARGQGQDFWIGRVAKLLPAVQQQMTQFASKLTSPSAQTAFDTASAAIDNFQKLDNRAQEFVRGDNGLLAADLIFSDGLEATTTATTQLDMALNEELRASETTAASHRNRQLATLAGSAGGVLLILVMLAFLGSATEPEESREPAQPQPQPVAEFIPVSPSLSHAAQLCTDFARVLDSKQLPALLERTARVLDASGIIVWMAEPASNSLKAAMSFGYSDQVVARLGNIHRDANNAVAAAYRGSQVRTVNGDASANGALVIPLLTSDGCIGALSAEMKGGSEKDESSQALAAIFAAQLATLVSPPIVTAQVQAAAHA